MKVILCLVVLFCVTGCDIERWEKDQDLRRVLFKECMQLLPAGPKSTVYSDWDEVVSECNYVSYSQSRRCIENCSTTIKAVRGE